MSDVLHLPDPQCAQARSMLALFADGELSGGPSAWLSAHLETCAECREALAAFSEIDGALAAWGQTLELRNPAPPGARERLAAGMEEPARRRAIWAIPAIAATLAAGFALVAVAPRRTPPPAKPEAPPFVAIPYLPPLDPRENATVVRMNVRVAALVHAGYKVAADPDEVVLADVLVGEDGRAHAVRLLSGVDWNLKGD
jgi:anti-sigma factor RsiW